MNLWFNIFQIIASSLLVVISIYNLLPFSISHKDKSILLSITFLNNYIAYNYGNIAILSLLLCLSWYLFFKVNRSYFSIFAIIAGYIISTFGSNTCVLLLQHVFNVKYNVILATPQYYFLSFICSIITIWLLSYLCGILIKKYTKLFSDSIFTKEAWLLTLLQISLCAIIFAFNIIAGEQLGYTNYILTFNTILFLLYFTSSIIILMVALRTYSEKSKLALKETQFQNLQEYTANIESMYSNIHTFKHDYINILSSMLGYIELKDFDGLELYFKEQILPTANQLNNNMERLSRLGNIHILPLKGLLSSKFIYAHEIGVSIFINTIDRIDIIPMDIVDLSRILGIFLDNSIEAALETEKPKLSFNLIKTDQFITIIISNTFIDYNLPISQLKMESFSTKGHNRGLGLHNVDKILKNYSNVTLTTTKDEKWFTQHLEILKESCL